MNTELQNKAWSVLPKEFKEEVKKEYYDCKHCNADTCAIEIELETVFGKHNLTSDAEGEEDEMLHVSRKKLQYFYEKLRKVGENHAVFALQSLFGSKCLPENVATSEPNVDSLHANVDSLEPKFKVGDKVKIIGAGTEATKARIGYVGEIVDIDPRDFACFVLYPKGQDWIRNCDLEPYTEPKEDHIGENTEMVKDFDTILKDGFSKERRLNIAATILGNIIQSGYYSLSEKYRKENMSEMAKLSLQLTDALIVAMKSATERIP